MDTGVLNGLKYESMKEKVKWFSRFSPNQRYKIMTGLAEFILTVRNTNKKVSGRKNKEDAKILQGIHKEPKKKK